MKNKQTAKSKIKKLNDGKFFEMIVECLQLMLATDGLTVSCGRKFYDVKGKQVGEVDVVIEGQIDSVNIMVGVECRDRKDIPGVAWIQQVIGRRVALAKFGFSHWIAVSRQGFAKTAIDLAKEHNIPLLVPRKVEPVDQNKPGFHTFMELSITYPKWIPDKFEGVIFYDDNKTSEEAIDKIEAALKITPPNVNTSGMKPIQPTVENYCAINEKKFNSKSEWSYTFKFDDIDASINGRKFKFKNFEITVNFYQEKVKSDFQIMAFIIPDNEKKLKKILGIIGINEYKFDDIAYMMVGIKPDNPYNFVYILRDSQGKPVKNRKVVLSLPKYVKKTKPV